MKQEELEYWGTEENFNNHSHCNDVSGPIYSHEYVIKLTNRIKLVDELIELIDNMHKPEYASFFVGEEEFSGYELADLYRKKLMSLK